MMKKLFSILTLCMLALLGRADVLTYTLTITNLPAFPNTYTINGNTVQWTNLISTPSTQVGITNSIGWATTNMFAQISAYLATGGISVSYNGTTGVVVRGPTSLTMSVSTGWATLASATVTSGGQTMVLPITSQPFTAQRTNLASLTVAALDGYATAALFSTNSPSLKNFVPTNGLFYGIILNGIVSNGTISGTIVAITNGTWFNGILSNAVAISGNVASLTNGGWLNASLTNGQNFGNAFRSPGVGSGSEQFGLGAIADATDAIAFGDGARANGNGASALGKGTLANDVGDTAIGDGATVTSISGTSQNATAVGFQSTAFADGATALGANSGAFQVNSTAIGAGASTTQTNQVEIGNASGSVDIPGVLNVAGISNITTLTTSVNTMNGKFVVPSATVSGIVNGNNTIDPGTNSYITLSGATGAFTIASIKGGISDRFLWVENSQGQTMTIANQSGFDSTAANRVLSGYSADRTFTNNPSVIGFRYDGSASRWKIISVN